MATEGGPPGPTSVVLVGDDQPVEGLDGLEVTEASGDGLRERAAAADCVVAVEPGGGLDVLASVAGTAVPTLLYDRDGDPAVAARASRLGVTEYVVDAALGDETLADRVRAAVVGDRARAESALEALHDVATDRTLTLEEKVERLLTVGRQRLDLQVGFLNRVDGDETTVEAVSGSHPSIAVGASRPLSETHCRRTVDGEGLLGLEDATGDDAVLDDTGLRCYLGGTVGVDGELYGTVCFGGESPRSQPFSARERRFVELLVEWLSYELERADHERELSRYKAIHETVEEMVFVVGEGTTIEQVTAPLVERFGYDEDELLGSAVTDLLGEDAVQAGFEAFERLREGAESVTVETEIPTAGGEAVPVAIDLSLLSSSTDFEGLVGVVHDQTALSETRAELEAQRDRFQSLFDQLPDAVVDAEFVDGEPYVRAVNPAFEEVFGYDADAAVGRSVNELIVPDGRLETARRLDTNAMAEGFNMAEVERETADGRRTFLFRGFIYATEDGTDRGFGIYTDVTDRLEQERRLRVLHRVLRHNLRNEMTGVIGFSELLAERVEDPEDREYAERIHARADAVVKLGEQVQRIERALDRDRQRSRVDPGGAAARVAERFRERHPEATVRVDCDGSVVVADDLLELAIENLVENAIVHHDGTPTVTVEIRAVDEGWVDLTVRDDGPGIPERERAVVGGDREITQLDHSRGLGLWVARWIVEGVGGRLRFEEPEEGSAVTLRLQHVAESRGG